MGWVYYLKGDYEQAVQYSRILRFGRKSLLYEFLSFLKAAFPIPQEERILEKLRNL